MDKAVHFDANLCIMTRFFGLISGKWKPIILYLVQQQVNRFSLMQDHMPAISRKILTEQLKELEFDGLIRREELKNKAPKVVVYHLTEKGASLRELINEIIAWSLENMKDEVPHHLIKSFVNSYPHLPDARLS